MSLRKVVVLLLFFGVTFINMALAVENVEYNIIAPDYIDVEKNQAISGILSYTDVTDTYDAAPWGLDWGEAHAPYKWKVETSNGDVTIGFERYETISTDPRNITFFWTVTEQIGNHTETRYRREQQPLSGIPLISSQATIQGTGWWNSAWQYRIDNPIPSGTRPYQLSLIISNSAGINNATHIFLNGHANPDLSDIRFTLNNATELSYWIEDASTGKVWVRVPSNGVVNMYYGNPSATDSSDGKATFEFFDDFSALDLGANPVMAPSQQWESGKSLRWGSIAHLNGIYYIYYTNGAGNTSDIGRATSTDLITWTKNPGNPVINDSIGPSLLKELDGKTPVFQDGKYWMITMKYNGSAIELRSAASIDSDIWTLENSSLIPKVSGWYENKLFTTSFVKENNEYHIFMEAKNNNGIYQVGHLKALSPGGPYIDQGVLLSPTFSWEGTNIMDPEIRKFDNKYYLFYTAGNDKPFYNSSYATSLNLAGPYTKTQIQVTPLSQTYPEISLRNNYYYVLTDDHTPVNGTGKNLYRRNDLNGIFSSPFDWYKGGDPTVSGSELLINANGEYTRSIPAFLYKAMKVKAKYAPQTADNSYQYFGFTASKAGSEKNSAMFFSYENDLKAFSGNSVTSENTSIYNPSYFGSYHNYEILWRQGESKFIIDDELKATQTTSVADIPLPVGMYDYNTNASLFVDWVFVRNYISPEPAWAAWGTEKASSGGDPSTLPPLPNAPTFLITPTYDESGEVVHPDMYYNANGWNGFKYWMAITPYPGGNDAFENPSILASNDGISWSVPAGLTNPIDPEPASGVNSDPDIVYNDTVNRLEVYYVEADGGSGGTSYLKRRTSTDGITWSNEQDIFNLTNYQIMSPGIIRKDGVYEMWYDDASSCSAATTYVKYRTSTDGTTWSSSQKVNIDQPGQNIWHLDVNYIPSKNEYWMIYAAYPSGSTCGNTDIYFAKSTDKINWTTYDKKIMDRGSWDSDSIYRSTFLYDSSTDMLRVWYTAKGNNIRHIGYSERKYTDFLDSLIGAPSSQGAPAITSWNNDKTNDNSPSLTINTSENINFNATANQTITTWNWFKDGINQNNNFDDFTASWSTAGTKTVKVNATNSNGTTDTITWTVTVNAPSALGKPSIISWINGKTNDSSLALTINTSENVKFNATANQTITTWNWLKDGANQNNNFDNLIASWSTAGTKTIAVNATNSNGTTDTITWVVTVNALTSQDRPIITSWNNNKTNDDSQSLIINTSETVKFNVTANQTITTWNWSEDGINQNNNFDNFIVSWSTPGIRTITVSATNSNGTTDAITWIVTVNALISQDRPIITSWNNGKTNDSSLALTINTSENVKFNVTANQTITTWNWFKDGENQNNNLDNLIASWSTAGTKIVKANATNSNGTSDTITWTVTVNEPAPLIITVTSPENNRTGNVTVKVNLNREGTSILNWNGVNESMDGAGTSFYRNKTGLFSGVHRFRVYANDPAGISSVSETRTITVNRSTSSELEINMSDFIVNSTEIITSPGGNVTVTVPKGTNASVNGSYLPSISIDSLAEVNATFIAKLGSGDRLIGENLSLGPAGAIFRPDIQIRFNYTDQQLAAAGVSESGLSVRYYNTTIDSWEPLAIYERNTSENYIIVNASHFSTFALIGVQTMTTTTPSSSGGGSSSGSGGGGGGGGASGESYANIVIKEKYDKFIYKDKLTSYAFTHKLNPVLYINVTGNVNAGETSAAIEVLKDTSSLLKSQAPGKVYQNMNIWLGTSGFATAKNIKEAAIRFRVDNAWIDSNSLDAKDINMVRWDGAKWTALETKVVDKDGTNTYFEASTDGFSHFAVTGLKETPQPIVTVPAPAQTSGTPDVTKVSQENAPPTNLIVILAVLIGVVIVAYLGKGIFKK